MMMRSIIVWSTIFFVMILAVRSITAFEKPICLDSHEWTWLYTKVFSSLELKNHHGHGHLTFEKYGVPHFSQLLFSWNCMRPKQGHFRFKIQVRDAKRKKWGPWHTMSEWGAGVQRSFAQTQPGLSSYTYVRLEVDSTTKSDAFRVQVEALDGASLASLHAFSVSLSDTGKFMPEKIGFCQTRLPSVFLPKVPKKSQFLLDHAQRHQLCSPTSLSMLVSYLSHKPVEADVFAHHVFDHGLKVYGSWPFNIAHAYEHCDGSFLFSVARLNSFKALHGYLMRGIPVVVSVRGEMVGAPKPYPSGHLLLVVGWDAKKNLVICHDPAAGSLETVLRGYEVETFIRAWERSKRLAYLAEPQRKNT